MKRKFLLHPGGEGQDEGKEIMRLEKEQISGIKTLVANEFGTEAEVCLFGSRVDDNKRGGDIDLFIRTPSPVNHPAGQAANLSAKISRLCHGRKVDVLIHAPNLLELPIHQIALQQGIRL